MAELHNRKSTNSSRIWTILWKSFYIDQSLWTSFRGLRQLIFCSNKDQHFGGLKLKPLCDGLLRSASKHSPNSRRATKTGNPHAKQWRGFEKQHGVLRTYSIRQFPAWIWTRILKEAHVEESFRQECTCCQELFYVYWCIYERFITARSDYSKLFVCTGFLFISTWAQHRKLFNCISQPIEELQMSIPAILLSFKYPQLLSETKNPPENPLLKKSNQKIHQKIHSSENPQKIQQKIHCSENPPY